MKNTIGKKLIVFSIFVLAMVPTYTFAQPDPGCDPCCGESPLPPGCNCPPQCVPIDGGLSLLIAAGIGLGAKKAYDRKKATLKNQE